MQTALSVLSKSPIRLLNAKDLLLDIVEPGR